METRRWTNPSQPQTLYLATWLLYINADITILFSLIGGGPGLLGIAVVAAEIFAAYGIANEKRWGYIVGVLVAGLGLVFALWPLVFELSLIFDVSFLLYVLFPVALFALLVHPMSRDYQRIWFK